MGLGRLGEPFDVASVGTAKRFYQGTHRAVAPDVTFARVKKLFEPLGVTRVANITGLDSIGIPVVSAYRPNSRSLAVSQGKGIDIEAARTSAVMEAIEFYHAERVGLPLKYMSWNELGCAEPVVNVDRLPRLSVSRFRANLALLWIEGRDLMSAPNGDITSADPRWLPFELVHTNYEQPFPPGSGYFLMTSNGLASGNQLIEAICHGLCEVIERDATTLFAFLSAEEQHARQVKLETVSDPECVRLLGHFERAGVAVGVWDATSDIGVPTFLCVILDREPTPFRPLRPVEGMGCHPVREIAFIRALTEAAQARLTRIAGARDDSREHYFGHRVENRLANARARLQRRGERSWQSEPTFIHHTFDEDVEFMLGRLRGAGIDEVIAVDLTKPGLDIPVVRIVVPGLEPYRHAPGYVPGDRALSLLEARKCEAAG